jgi:hypothetical protein
MCAVSESDWVGSIGVWVLSGGGWPVGGRRGGVRMVDEAQAAVDVLIRRWWTNIL